jgi:hypothetical protein
VYRPNFWRSFPSKQNYVWIRSKPNHKKSLKMLVSLIHIRLADFLVVFAVRMQSKSWTDKLVYVIYDGICFAVNTFLAAMQNSNLVVLWVCYEMIVLSTPKNQQYSLHQIFQFSSIIVNFGSQFSFHHKILRLPSTNNFSPKSIIFSYNEVIALVLQFLHFQYYL